MSEDFEQFFMQGQISYPGFKSFKNYWEKTYDKLPYFLVGGVDPTKLDGDITIITKAQFLETNLTPLGHVASYKILESHKNQKE